MTADAARALRLGCVGYLNARPLIAGWSGAVQFDHPAALCAQLAAGELDVALVSSFEYLRDPGYAVIDGIAIASDGPVYSVIVASADPFEQLKTIELDPASVTSVNLLRCLLANRPVSFSLRGGAADSPIPSGMGRLLIGDQAIRFRQAHERTHYIADLGEAWRSKASLPFVYALWLVRAGIEAIDVADRLRRRRDDNLRRLNELAAKERDFGSEFVRNYWTQNLKFGFADREKAGLIKFRSLCQEQGILPRSTAHLKVV
ncbi:MAG: menaquinone biosynthesis protein [Chthoniobacterales bacterium]